MSKSLCQVCKSQPILLVLILKTLAQHTYNISCCTLCKALNTHAGGSDDPEVNVDEGSGGQRVFDSQCIARYFRIQSMGLLTAVIL